VVVAAGGWLGLFDRRWRAQSQCSEVSRRNAKRPEADFVASVFNNLHLFSSAQKGGGYPASPPALQNRRLATHFILP
jgi:hypothetical protein